MKAQAVNAVDGRTIVEYFCHQVRTFDAMGNETTTTLNENLVRLMIAQKLVPDDIYVRMTTKPALFPESMIESTYFTSRPVKAPLAMSKKTFPEQRSFEVVPLDETTAKDVFNRLIRPEKLANRLPPSIVDPPP